MAQIFHRSTNTIARVSIYGAVFLLLIAGYLGYAINASPYFTEVNNARPQPVPFSHKHHVGELGLDCRYCHTTVEDSPSAGMPPTQTCMTCHSQIWSGSPTLEPVRASYRDDRSISWTRVNAVPDFVYFNHSIHIAKGVGCSSCHGEVGQMPLSYKAKTLTMQFCLDCHRDPGPNLRPKDQIYNTEWRRTAGTASPEMLMTEYHIGGRNLTDCSICHR
jgi:Cytochrome c7 and related cytochrome c